MLLKCDMMNLIDDIYYFQSGCDEFEW